MSSYIPAQIPDELASTFVELAWRAADHEAHAPQDEPFDAILTAAVSVHATDAQIDQLTALVCQGTAARYPTHEAPVDGWIDWREHVLRAGDNPWQILADTAMLISSPLDIELGLRSGHWSTAPVRDHHNE